MVSPIQSLSNMEYALYGNSPNFGSTAAPSMINGYYTASPYLTNSYPYYNAYNSYPYSNYQQDIFTPQQNTVQTPQIAQSDLDKVADFYNKASQPSESLVSAAIGGAAFGLINNPRLIVHPINSIGALKNTEKMFASIKTPESFLNQLWTNPETNDLARELYFRWHKVEARHHGWKIGAFRKKYSEADYEELKKIVNKAIESGKQENIVEAVAKLKTAYTNDGFIARGFGKVKEFFGGAPKVRTVTDALATTNKKAIEAEIAGLEKTIGKVGFKEALKRGGGVKGGLFFMGIELLMGLGKIIECFKQDKENKQKGVSTNYGAKQLGQTLVKGAGSAVGWAAGEALGVMASAKICAAIGTAIAPGVGTAIGGVLGLIGGSIGCWATGKLTKWLVGQDVGEKVKIAKMKETPEGQIQLLQLTAQQKKIPLDVQQSMQNIAAQYASAA